ncbi:hypothetical protein C8Q79DRAFT_688566 [Trametes meyenii]|nr:hypothetical protein C8Q79DRAFT_688566 [Trametes meyenii]
MKGCKNDTSVYTYTTTRAGAPQSKPTHPQIPHHTSHITASSKTHDRVARSLEADSEESTHEQQKRRCLSRQSSTVRYISETSSLFPPLPISTPLPSAVFRPYS